MVGNRMLTGCARCVFGHSPLVQLMSLLRRRQNVLPQGGAVAVQAVIVAAFCNLMQHSVV